MAPADNNITPESVRMSYRHWCGDAQYGMGENKICRGRRRGSQGGTAGGAISPGHKDTRQIQKEPVPCY